VSEIIVIAAVAQNGIIGRNGTMPWHISEDFKRYKSLTLGHTVIMGDRTWISLPVKPQPGRKNIVLSFDAAFKAEGADVFPSMESALEACKNDGKIFLIGGASVYRKGVEIADTLELTRIGRCIEGDTYFPEVDFSRWILTAQEDRMHDEFGKYSFLTYRRASGSK
jgi:dihydrofolate reductase